MNKRFLPGKLLPVWIAVSALLIIAGIVMYAVFGFNYVRPEKKTIEVSYDAVVSIEDREADLEKACEDAIAQKGVSYSDKQVSDELEMTYVSENGYKRLTYTFGSDVSDETLSSLREAVEASVTALGVSNADIHVTAHTLRSERLYEASWRAAVALAVAGIVSLVYVGFRFGWGNAIAGLVGCVNDTLLTLSIFAIARIPVYAYAPMLFAGVAMIFSVVLWLLQCARMRENFKDPAYESLSAGEAVATSVLASRKLVCAVLIPIAVAIVVLGALASGGVRLFVLPLLLPLAVSVYSSFLLAPAVFVPLKSKFDKLKSSRKRYVGKKKAQETPAETQA